MSNPIWNTDPLDAAIDSALQQQRIVGCVVLGAQDGRLVHARAAGLADRETGREMSLDTPFRLSSVTKPFTTMAALRLMAAGRLDPDAPVTAYLPEFQLSLTDGESVSPTIAQLMAHLAGLDYGFQQPVDGSYARAGISDGLDASPITLDENIRRIASVPVDVRPGTQWRYSVATDVLGKVIEAASGSPLDAAIRDLVTEPLNLGARFHWPDADLAAPYHDAQPQPERMDRPTTVAIPGRDGAGVRFDPARIHRPDAWHSGGGGMAGRASDVLALLEQFRDGDLLTPEWRAAAFAPRVGAEAMARGPGWGFSWLGAVLVYPAAAGSSLSRGTVSWGGVYGHCWIIDPARGRTLIALTNTAVEGMIGQFARDLTGAASV